MVKTVLLYRDHQLTPDMLTKSELKVILNNINVDNVEDYGKTPAFKNDFLSAIYRRQIEQFEEFILVRKSASFYDFDSTGVIQFSLVFPFNSIKYRKEDLNCLAGDDLPPFYQNKTAK